MSKEIISAEWDNSPKLEILLISIAMITFFLTTGTQAYFLSIDEAKLAATASFLNTLFLFSLIIYVAEVVFERVRGFDFFEKVGFGKSTPSFIMATVVGIAFAVILNYNNLQMLVPMATTTVQNPSFITNLLFTVVFAAIVEETFFRGALLPTFHKVFQFLKTPSPVWLAIIGQALIFGLYHYGAYGADFSLIWISVLFGIICGVGNGFFKSAGFSYALHLTNNFLVLKAMGVI